MIGRRGSLGARAAAGAMLVPVLLGACAAHGPRTAGDAQTRAATDMDELTDLRARAEELFRARRYELARDAFLELAARAATQGDRAQRVEGLALAARMETLVGDLVAARTRLAEAQAEADPDEPLGWSRCLLVRGIVEREGGERDAARATWERAYAYCTERGLALRAVDAAHFIALLGDLAQALEWTPRALRAAEAAGDERWQGVLWNNLGWSYHDAGRHAEAYDALVHARRFHQRGGDLRAARIADWSVACAARHLGRLAEARAALEPVLAWAEERQRAEPSADGAEWLGLTQRELGELALLEGRRGAAREHLERAARLLAEAGMDEWDAAGLAALRERVAELGQRP